MNNIFEIVVIHAKIISCVLPPQSWFSIIIFCWYSLDLIVTLLCSEFFIVLINLLLCHFCHCICGFISYSMSVRHDITTIGQDCLFAYCQLPFHLQKHTLQTEAKFSIGLVSSGTKNIIIQGGYMGNWSQPELLFHEILHLKGPQVGSWFLFGIEQGGGS